MVVPRLFFCPARGVRETGCFSLSELLVRKLYRWTRPCFSLTANFAAPEPNHPNGFQAHAFNAPTQNSDPVTRRFPGLFRPVFSVPKAPEFWADKPFTRCLDRP